MANLLITDVCNRKCPFCFAQERVSRGDDRAPQSAISRENFRKTLDFLETSGDLSIRMLGGEPSLHPEFLEMVDEAIGRGFRVQLFSNGIMSRSTADHLGRLTPEQVNMLCNVSPQANDPERSKEMMNYTLERLGEKIVLGISLTSAEFEYRFLIDLINKHKLRRRIRVGIAQPIVGKDNEYLKTSDYKKAGAAITQMARNCIKEDILIGFDCGMVLCMFTEEEIGFLAKNSEGFSSVCTPIVDIGQDLDVWHCFPLSEVLLTRLDKFRTRKDIVRFYTKQVAPFRSLGCMSECMACDYLRRGQCTGGCLAHTINSFRRKPPREAKDLPQPVTTAGMPGV